MTGIMDEETNAHERSTLVKATFKGHSPDAKTTIKYGFLDALVSAAASAKTRSELMRFTNEVVEAYVYAKPEGIAMPWGRVVKP